MGWVICFRVIRSLCILSKLLYSTYGFQLRSLSIYKPWNTNTNLVEQHQRERHDEHWNRIRRGNKWWKYENGYHWMSIMFHKSWNDKLITFLLAQNRQVVMKYSGYVTHTAPLMLSLLFKSISASHPAILQWYESRLRIQTPAGNAIANIVIVQKCQTG